jgi:peptidyl-Lys metalloendopeptidase
MLRLCLLLAILGGSAAAAPTSERTKSQVNVRVQLSVQAVGHEVVATLVFSNRSKAPQSVDKRMGCLDGKMRTRVFSVLAAGHEVPFLLPMRKLPAPGPDDYLTLAPGEKVEARVHLDGAYDFLPGKHTYRIRYDAFHGRPDASDLEHLRSNEVRLSIVR